MGSAVKKSKKLNLLGLSSKKALDGGGRKRKTKLSFRYKYQTLMFLYSYCRTYFQESMIHSHRSVFQISR